MRERREDYVYAFYKKKLTNIKRKKDIPKELTTNEETTHESQNTQTCHGISLRLSANEPIESPINSQCYSLRNRSNRNCKQLVKRRILSRD